MEKTAEVVTCGYQGFYFVGEAFCYNGLKPDGTLVYENSTISSDHTLKENEFTKTHTTSGDWFAGAPGAGVATASFMASAFSAALEGPAAATVHAAASATGAAILDGAAYFYSFGSNFFEGSNNEEQQDDSTEQEIIDEASPEL